MTVYEQLVQAEKTCHTIEIIEKDTGKQGVANTCSDGVAVWYGADDGSDDKIVSPEEFSRDFDITAMISDADCCCYTCEEGMRNSCQHSRGIHYNPWGEGIEPPDYCPNKVPDDLPF